jgi:hypothetical protein
MGDMGGSVCRVLGEHLLMAFAIWSWFFFIIIN